MSPDLYQFISSDLPAMLTATLAAVACGLLGNFLVLRRMSLLGDAISHAVLPGLVVAFLISGTRSTWPMFLGAAAAGIITAVLTELVRKLGKVESGAAMGVVFSVLFALGVLLLEQAAARSVDLDADCVLNGQLEDVFWLPPMAWDAFWTWDTFLGAPIEPGGARENGLPRELVTLAVTTAVAIAFIALFFKELRVSAFDPQLATSLGFNAGLMHYALVVFVAAAAVASFEAVGSILVIGMLICPAATARMLTDRLGRQVWLSVGLALVSGIGGYTLAAYGPLWLGGEHSLNAAGMITLMAGLLLALAIVASPTHGVVAREVKRLRLAVTIAREDLLALLYRVEELTPADDPGGGGLPPLRVIEALGGGLIPRVALRRAIAHGEIEPARGTAALTQTGRRHARLLVRTHRLWESFLVRELGLRPDHVHNRAMQLEHVTTPTMQDRLAADGAAARRDPHDRPIPPP